MYAQLNSSDVFHYKNIRIIFVAVIDSPPLFLNRNSLQLLKSYNILCRKYIFCRQHSFSPTSSSFSCSLDKIIVKLTANLAAKKVCVA